MTEVILRARMKPKVKPRNFWYERRGLLRMMYEKYRKGGITAEVLMDAFKVDRMKPVISAYHRMYGKVPKKYDVKQLKFPFAFSGLIEHKEEK